MTQRRRALFAAMAVVLSVVVVLGLLLAVDLYLHWKFSDDAGLNAWGYRGPEVGRKQAGEWRLAVVGESTAFGYGVRWWEAIPALLQERLNAGGGTTRATVVNLAYNNEGAHSYRYALEDYEYLDYDAVLFYSGYNDLEWNTRAFRRTSVVFRLSGYMPIFPLIFSEKAMAIRAGGALEDAYRGRQTTFVPNLAQRATATALETAANISRSLDRQFAQDSAISSGGGERIVDAASSEGTDCGPDFEHYCGEMYVAMRFALDRDKQVLMVTQPFMNARHREQQAMLRSFLERRFNANPRLRFASMGEEIDLKDRSLAYDGMHLTVSGNQRIAAALEPHVRRFMR